MRGTTARLALSSTTRAVRPGQTQGRPPPSVRPQVHRSTGPPAPLKVMLTEQEGHQQACFVAGAWHLGASGSITMYRTGPDSATPAHAGGNTLRPTRQLGRRRPALQLSAAGLGSTPLTHSAVERGNTSPTWHRHELLARMLTHSGGRTYTRPLPGSHAPHQDKFPPTMARFWSRLEPEKTPTPAHSPARPTWPATGILTLAFFLSLSLAAGLR